MGAARLLDDLRGFGWAIVGVVAFELVIDACNTVAWRHTLPPDAGIGFWSLFWVRQAGVAINQVTPTATVGGEVVKTILLRPHLRSAVSAASLVAARMSYALGQTTLVLLGLSAVLGRTRDTPDLALAVVAAFVATVGGVLGFVWLQRRGIFATAAAALRRLGIARGIADHLHAGGAALDTHLSDFYRDRPRAFAASIVWRRRPARGTSATGVHPGGPRDTDAARDLSRDQAFALVLDAAAFIVGADRGSGSGTGPRLHDLWPRRRDRARRRGDRPPEPVDGHQIRLAAFGALSSDRSPRGTVASTEPTREAWTATVTTAHVTAHTNANDARPAKNPATLAATSSLRLLQAAMPISGSFQSRRSSSLGS